MAVRGTTVAADEERIAFAQKAAETFKKNPTFATFGNIGPGELLAIRWGMGNDCVLTIRQHETEEAVNYRQLIPRA